MESKNIIHIIGIGGVCMAGIAIILKNRGYRVQGSDIVQSCITDNLKASGIKVFFGHDKKNVEFASLILKSSAVQADNPEITYATENYIPIMSRAEILAQIMSDMYNICITGAHGKTTTTSLISHLLYDAGIDPTILSGGVIKRFKSNVVCGHSQYIIAEADESDKTFLQLPTTIGIVTNIDYDHLENYDHKQENLREAYKRFLENIPSTGSAILCFDDPEIPNICNNIACNIITYAINNEADLVAYNLTLSKNQAIFDVKISNRLITRYNLSYNEINNIIVPLNGSHNVLNALASISVCIILNITPEVIKKALSTFEGVDRRFTIVSEHNNITIIDDYAHHPNEISATIDAAKIWLKQGSVLIAVIEPHRYTRVQDLLSEFGCCTKRADYVIVLDIYPAGEAPIDGISAFALIAEMQKHGITTYYASNTGKLADICAKISNNGDVILCMGAGSITHIAKNLAQLMKDKRG